MSVDRNHVTYYQLHLEDSVYEEYCFSSVALAEKSVVLSYGRHPEGIPRVAKSAVVGPDDENDRYQIMIGGVCTPVRETPPNFSSSDKAFARHASSRTRFEHVGEREIGYISVHSLTIYDEVMPV